MKLYDREVLCDKNTSCNFKNSICFENYEKELSKTMIKIAKDKYKKSTDKEDFNYMNVQANYIQTPPVF